MDEMNEPLIEYEWINVYLTCLLNGRTVLAWTTRYRRYSGGDRSDW